MFQSSRQLPENPGAAFFLFSCCRACKKQCKTGKKKCKPCKTLFLWGFIAKKKLGKKKQPSFYRWNTPRISLLISLVLTLDFLLSYLHRKYSPTMAFIVSPYGTWLFRYSVFLHFMLKWPSPLHWNFRSGITCRKFHVNPACQMPK